LNGTSQTLANLQSPGTNGNAFFGSGGTVTSTGGAATLVSRQANSNWGGQITGPVTFVMGNTVAGNVERFYQDNTYTGRTLVTGGILELTDGGRLSGTTAIDLSGGLLNIQNTSASNGRQNLTDRIPDATPINLSTGAILFGGRAQTASSETLGTVTLVKGNSNFNLTAGGTGVNSSELTLTSLVQGSIDATTNVQGASGQVGSTTRLFIGNGTALLSNNILPTWIQSGASEFMSYNSSVGAMALSAAGAPGYDGTTLPTVNSGATAIGNYRIGASGVVPSGGLTVNTLNVNGAFNVTFGTTSSTDVLNIGASGLIKSGATGTSIGSVVDEGRLTAGGATPTGTVPLYLYNGVNGSSFTINSRIVDNGASPIRLAVNNFNGGTTVITNGNNSYTGGTVVNGWVNGAGGGLSITGTGTIPAGGLTINNSTVTTSAAGQINAANTVNLNASSTLTLVGNNTLTGLNIDNYGGLTAPTVNTGGTLNLTNGITASSSNISTLPVINGTLDFAGGTRTFAINPISYNGVGLNALQPTLNIAGVIQNSGAITKTGNGVLQLSAQNTFSGGINLTAGGLALNASSTPQVGIVTSGPLGTGTLTTSAGTTLLGASAVTLANNLTLLGNLNFDGLNNLTFTGTTTLPASPITINVAAPQQTVGLLGSFVNPTTNISKTGYGTLNLSPDYAGTLTLALGGIFGLADDGNGTGTPADITSAMIVNSTGTTTINIGRTGFDYAPYFSTASNKTFKVGNVTTGGGTLIINNNNGYGLDITGTQTLSADQVYNVTNATGSNVVQGLTLSGQVTGGFNVVKTGSGTLVLTNATNNFGGAGKLIDIQGGIVSASSDGALGDASNVIKLNVAGTTGVGFRSTGTFATSRVINLAQATNAIEVTAGNELTINSAFTGLSATSQLVKNDLGTLTLNAANTLWNGSITAAGGSAQVLTGGLLVNAGVVKITNASALGATTNIVAVNSISGAQVQIGGGITVPNPLVLNTNTAAGYFSGINGSGSLRSIGNGVTNTWSGAISENQDAGITADSGNILELTGGINLNAHIGVFGGVGTINVKTGAITTVHTIDKIGSGTTNIQVATAAPTGNGIRVFAGALTFSGAGAVAGAGTIATVLNPGGTLNLDSSGTVVANRLGGRVMTLTGGNLNLIGGATATGEAIGAPTFNRGQTTITVTAGAGGANLTFTAASNNVNPAQTTGGSGATALFRGTSLGTAAGANISTIAWTAGGLGFNGNTGATDTATKGIVPWALIDTTASGLGNSFVTANSAAAAGNTGTALLRPLNTLEYGTGNLVANNNMLVTTALAAQATTTVNSLTFGTGGSLAMGSTNGVGNSLISSSGGILVRNGVTTTISGGLVSIPAANSALNVHTPGTAALTISSVMTGGNAADRIGLVKAGAGSLTLSTPKSALGGLTNVSVNTLNMQTAVNQGTLTLNGGTNTLGANNFLAVGPGGTLNLNGTSQYVRGLFTDGSYNGVADTVTAGGTVTSSTAATLVTNSDARNWAGQITGNVFYNRTGTVSTTTIYTPQPYTGGTLINGGTVSLRDFGKLTGTSGIDLNYATLALDNTQAADITGRLGTAPVNMRGGILSYAGRAQTASAETIGSVNIAEGWNSIFVTNGGTGVNSADLTIASLLHTGGSAGVVNLANATGNPQQNGQIGSTSRLLITASPTLTNNIIAPWAIASRDWASYIPTLGTGALNATGFAGYATTNIVTGSATDNVRVTATPAALTADETIGTLNLNYGASTTVDLGTRTLTLAGGGLIIGTGSASTGTISNGNLTSGALNVGGDFYTHFLPYAGTGRVSVISANITDNGSGPVRFILSSSEISGTAQTVTLNGTNTHSGGTVLNLGTTVIGATGTLPAGGITLNSATLNQAIAGQAAVGVINPANIVTLNGPSTLNLVNNNTLAGLVFNNNGATSMGAAATSANSNPTVNTSTGGVGTNGRGILTIGASGIVASSSNVATTSSIAGRIDMGSSANTITVNPITVNGVNVAPLQAALAVGGFTGSTGGITKNGNGVLQLNAQSTFTGALDVTAGGLNMGLAASSGLAGTSQAGSRYSALTLSANTWLNLTNTDATIGSLAGAGNVINVAPSGAAASGRTLNVGFDGTSTAFAGSFARWSDQLAGSYQVNKIGAGTMSLTGSSTTTNTLQVSQGGVTFSGAGNALFGIYTILPSATLTLNNSTTNVQHRLGGNLVPGSGTLNISGGEFRIVGSSTTNTLENIATVNMGTSAGNLYGNPIITLVPNAGFSISLGTNTFGGIPVGSSSLIRGVSATPSAGTAIFNIGLSALGSPTGSGTGINGTTTMGIRPDILGDVSPTGLGTGFIVKDSANNTLRPLTTAEMATTIASGFAGTTVNYSLSSAVNISGRTTLGSVALNSGGGLLQEPVLSTTQPDGLPISTVINTGGILAFTGNTGITTGRLETNNSNYLHLHTLGNLSISSVIFGAGGLTKGDAGTLTLTSRSLYTGQTIINAGTVMLSGGDNTLPFGATTLNGPTAVLDLNGTNQIVGTFGNNGSARYAGGGGTLTNSSLTPSVFTTNTGTTQNFSGSITGNLTYNRTGNAAVTLTNVNTFTGATHLRANTTTLLDAGTLSGTSAVNLYYAGLNIDQSGLNPIANLNPTRIPATTPVTLRGGTVAFTSGGSADYSQTINTLNVSQGHNTLSIPNAPTGATGALNIGNIVLSADATLNVVGGGSGGAVGFFSTAPGNGFSNLYITSINGTAIPATITGKILPANIITNNGEFTTYVQAATPGTNGQNYGVLTMNGIGTIAQSQYETNVTAGAALPTSNALNNIRTQVAGAANLPAGGANYNVLALRATGVTLTFAAAADVLNLTAGGLALTGNTAIVGSAVGNGTVTAGGTATGTIPLYVHNTGAIFNSAITNNASGGIVRLVANTTANTLTLTGVNTYTGGTVVNGGTVVLSGAGTIPAGGLTINGGTVTTTAAAAANQIAITNDVILNGSSNLTLGNVANTLKSLSFDNTGGITNPTVGISNTSLTLTDTNAITAVNDNVFTGPVISGNGALTLPAGANINVSSTNQVPVGLTISSPLASAGAINKTGSGALDLTIPGTFAGGFNVNAGTLLLGVNSTPTTGTVTSGPVGTGTLTLADGTALASDVAIRTIANAVTINGNVTFGALNSASANALAANGLVLNGPVSLGAATNRSINVNSLLNVSTIGGVISGSGSSLAKTGPGTLVLTGINTYDGGTRINGGVVQTTSTGIGSTGAITFGGGILRHAAATTTDFSGRVSTANNQPIYIDTNNQNITYASALTSATGGSLGKFGLGTLILTNTATYDGATIISEGTLQVGAGGTAGDIPTATNIYNNGALVWNRSNADTLSGIISGNGTLTKNGPLGAGSLTLSGANTFAGNVAINAGSLIITNSSALGTGTKTVTIIPTDNNTSPNSQPALRLDGTSGSITLPATMSFTTSYDGLGGGPNTANGAIINDAGNNTIQGNFTMTGGGGGTAIISNAGNLLLSGNITSSNAANRTVYVRGNGTAEISGVISNGTSPIVAVTRDAGTGVLTLSGTNTYTGPTTISTGTISTNLLANGGANSGIGASTNVAANLVFDGGTLKYSGASVTTDRNFTITAAKTATIDVSNSATNLTLGGAAAATTGALSKAGAGTLTLTAPQIYTGATNIDGGTLALGGAGSIADTTRVNLTASGTIFDIQGITGPTEILGSITSVSGSSIKVGPNLLDIGGDNTSFSSMGDISGTSGGSITKSGSGTMTLGGNNTYSVSTNVTSGTLLLASATALPSTAALNLSTGTTLSTGGFNQSTGVLSVSGTAPGSGATIDMSGGAAELTFSNVGTWTGLLSVWNYSGAPWTLGTDKLTFTSGSGSINLANVQFYSDSGTTLIGIGGGLIGTELVPVPEPTAATAALLLLGTLGYRERRRLLHFRK
jgi:autotransporter-associated beta strand protein